MVRALEGLDGVTDVGVRYEQRSFDVRYDGGRVAPVHMIAAIEGLGFEAHVAGQGPSAAEGAPPIDRSALDVRTISHGDAIDVGEHLVPGKYTVFDYYADWCGPCHLLARDLEALASQRQDVAIRKVDVVDWKSAAARQATEDYRLPGLPYVRVHAPDGRYLGAVEGNRIDAVRGLLEREAR